MKISFIAIFSVFYLGGCTYENIGPDVPTWGEIICAINGKEWSDSYPNGFQTISARMGISGTAMPCQNPYYVINADLYNSNAYHRQSLDFLKVPLSKGKYKVIRFTFQCNENDPVYGEFNTSGDDGDVGQDGYGVLETEDNYITVDFYDSQTKEIKGTFQVTFVIETRSLNAPSNLPDTLRFTDGQFHTKIL